METAKKECDCNEFPPNETLKEPVESETAESEIDENKLKKFKNKKNKIDENDFNKSTAKVIRKTKNGYIWVNLNGFGVKISVDKTYNIGDTIEIIHKGTIGKPDFTIAGNV